ncbi:MAG TPA: hypothetical protein PLK14_13270 [Sediminibacterium sp.]|nr:hypothetical protein [Sediminibacterium sp.]HQS56076.1 hypothetical protein [Sediminibacterium sp.]
MQSNYIKYLFSILLFWTLFHSNLVAAQGGVLIETLPSTKADGTINIYGRGTLSNRIPYDKITGNAFWKTEWVTATLIGRNKKERWEQEVKLNMASHEIYYRKPNGDEEVVNEGLVKKVQFHVANNPEEIIAIFLNGIAEPYVSEEPIKELLQVLNEGKYQLLKMNNRKLLEGDSLFGTMKRYYFKNEVKYLLANNYIVSPLKKLNKESILQLAPAGKKEQEWLLQNKVDFKKEADIVKYLTQLNSPK